MKLLLIMLSVFSFSSFAQALPAVPTIADEQLLPGRSWTWSYYEGEARKLHSTERYTVTEVEGRKVVFEIWTKYADSRVFTPSARLTVDLRKCEKAFRGQRQPFSIGMQGVENGGWSREVYSVRATAFEEKFNCNPFLYPTTHPLFSTVQESVNTPWGRYALFQQRPKVPSQILSFYFLDHPDLKATAYRKVFNADSPYEYAMELVGYDSN